MKVDLHVHSSERSACSRSGEEEMIRAAIALGLDGLAFTDHGRLVPPGRLAELNTRYAPFRVFNGIEANAEGEHFLVFGVADAAIEGNGWEYEPLYRFVRERGGFLVLAHPFRLHEAINANIESYPPDAVEIHSVHISKSGEARIRGLADRLGLGLVCSSDAHEARFVGLYYNVLEGAPETEKDLVATLRAGAYSCGRMDDHIAALNLGI